MADVLRGEDVEQFGMLTLEIVRNENTEQLISVVQQLNNSYEKEFAKIQKFVECSLRDVLEKLHTRTCDVNFAYLLWSTLSLSLVSPVAQKYMWRDSQVLASLKYYLETHANNSRLVKACANFLSIILVGASEHFFGKIANEEIISVLVTVMNNEHTDVNAQKSLVCSFGLLCDGPQQCRKQLVDLNVADAVFAIGERYATDTDFSELAALTYDDLVSLRTARTAFGRKKFIRSQVEDVIVCSNPGCLASQPPLTKFKKCSKCKLTVYCCKHCQVVHWKQTHHKLCK